jgi:opacity protein-like surface antigen
MGVVMKRIVLLGLVIASTASAELELSPYLSLNGGLAYVNDVSIEGVEVSLDGGYVAEGAIGLKIDRGIHKHPIRTEIAFSYQKNDLNKLIDNSGYIGVAGITYDAEGDATAIGLMFNVYGDFPLDNGLIPYLLAGVGGSYLEVDGALDSLNLSKDLVVAGQVGGGLGYALTESLILDLRYQYLRTADFKIEDAPADFHVATHKVTVGLRFEF